MTRAFEWMPALVPPDTNRQVFVYVEERRDFLHTFPAEIHVATYDPSNTRQGCYVHHWHDARNYAPFTAGRPSMWAEIPWPDDVDVMRHFRQFNPYEP